MQRLSPVTSSLWFSLKKPTFQRQAMGPDASCTTQHGGVCNEISTVLQECFCGSALLEGGNVMPLPKSAHKRYQPLPGLDTQVGCSDKANAGQLLPAQKPPIAGPLPSLDKQAGTRLASLFLSEGLFPTTKAQHCQAHF